MFCVFGITMSFETCVLPVDGDVFGLQVEPLTAVMQVQPREPHDGEQCYVQTDLGHSSMPGQIDQ